jgi:hypothetical protein
VLQSLAARQSMGLPVMRKCSPSSHSQFGHCSHGLCHGATQGTVGTLKADRPPRGGAAAHHRPWVLDSLPKHSPYSPLGPSLHAVTASAGACQGLKETRTSKKDDACPAPARRECLQALRGLPHRMPLPGGALSRAGLSIPLRRAVRRPRETAQLAKISTISRPTAPAFPQAVHATGSTPRRPTPRASTPGGPARRPGASAWPAGEPT